jgi:peptide/nickel transport system substrate-binding protein
VHRSGDPSAHPAARRSASSPFRLAVTGLCALLVAAGCSAAVPTTAPPSTTTSTTEAPTATSTTTTAVPPPGGDTSTTLPSRPVEPRYGGTLRYGLEADSLTPWTPQNTALATSGHMVMRAIYDTLALPTIDLEVKGNLLSDITPNDDYTVWTLTVRDGIAFHDGTPLDGAAVAENLERHRRSFVSGNILTDVASVAAEGMRVTVTMRRPWYAFPTVLTGQVGYVASPAWLAEVDADPARALEPVGTGPFVFESYTPGVSFTAVRNPDYWRDGLPYLDRVEFYPLRNIRDRSGALLAGDVDIIHTANGDEIAKFRDRLGAFDLVESVEFGETVYIMLNVGNPRSPVADLRVRTAMAKALDYELIDRVRNGSLFDVANGPFPPGSIGYVADTGYPTYDPEGARALVAEWEAENGPLEIAYKTTSDEFNLISGELFAQLWEEVGIDVTVDTIDQSLYIGSALVGDFEAYYWRLHSGFDPDQQIVWWDSANARDFGTVGLNFARIRDRVVDENLAVIRTSSDPAERRAAAEAVSRRFAEQLYYLWLGWAVWGIVSRPEVKSVNTGFTLPDGDLVLPTGVGIGGTHMLAQMWIDE